MAQYENTILSNHIVPETNSLYTDSSSNNIKLSCIFTDNINTENLYNPENLSSELQISNLNMTDTESVFGKTKVSKKHRINRYCPKEKDIEYRLECEYIGCKMLFTDMDLFLEHIDNHLNSYFKDIKQQSISDLKYECKWTDCDSEYFDCEFTFQRHFRFHAFHTKLKQIGLNVLKNELKEIPRCNLDDQTRNSIPILPYKFECSYDLCQYKTDNPEYFYRHIRNEHVLSYPSKLVNEKCKWSQCEQIIANKNRFVEHLRHHSQEKLVACPNCGALFASFSKFIDHCNRTNESGNLCYQCSHCNKKFSTNNLLKEHIRKHVNKFKCPICDMTCTAKNDLSKHILYKHTTHKSLKCSFCNHSSKTQHDLQKHINLKHNERFEYQCNVCDFKSKDLNIIKKHMVKIHMNTDKSNEANDSRNSTNGSYMCHVCNKTYGHGATLSRHLKSIHNFKWPSGHSRFRYKLDSDGFYRLQTLRYESVELIQQLNTDVNKIGENNIDVNHSATLFGYSSLSQIPNESIHLIDQNNKTKENLEKNRGEFDLENFLSFQQNKTNSQPYSSNSNSDNSILCLSDDCNLKSFFIERIINDNINCNDQINTFSLDQ